MDRKVVDKGPSTERAAVNVMISTMNQYSILFKNRPKRLNCVMEVYSEDASKKCAFSKQHL